MEQKYILILFKRNKAYTLKSDENPTWMDTNGIFDFSEEKEMKEEDIETFASKSDAMYTLVHDFFRYNEDNEEGNLGATYAIVSFSIAKAVFDAQDFDVFDKEVVNEAENTWLRERFRYSTNCCKY